MEPFLISHDKYYNVVYTPLQQFYLLVYDAPHHSD